MIEGHLHIAGLTFVQIGSLDTAAGIAPTKPMDMPQFTDVPHRDFATPRALVTLR